MKKVIVIIGPTAVGKTESAIALAQKFGGEIVNADSRQFYGELKIGTMLPNETQFQGIPHHFFGLSPLTEPWDAAHFQTKGNRLIEEITQRKKLPFVVGGTGLYVRALLFGIFRGGGASLSLRKELEKKIEEKGLSSLYDELQKGDPEAAERIHPHDSARIIRALEVYQETGLSISSHQKDHKFQETQYDYLKIGIKKDRKELYQKIEKRVDGMVCLGLEGEARNLHAKYGEHPLLSRTIGYQEWLPYFKGIKDRAWVIDLIKQHTRNLAKRQLTWFRKEKEISWFEAGDIFGMEQKISRFIESKNQK